MMLAMVVPPSSSSVSREFAATTELPRERVPLVSEVAGTWLVSSMMSFRELGVLDDALAKLSRQTREALQAVTPSSWVPTQDLLEYYAALDTVLPSSKECFEMGRVIGIRANRASVATATRAAGEERDGWPAALELIKMWLRLFRGGGLRAERVAPKEVRIEVMSYPMLRYSYPQHSARGVIHGFFEPFCQQVVVTELASPRPGLDALYRAQWR